MRSPSLPATPPRHPIRARLVRAPRVKKVSADDSDIKLFVLSFTAFFVCIYTLIF